MHSAVTYKANALHSYAGFHLGLLKPFTSISELSFTPLEAKIASSINCNDIWLLSLYDRNGVTLNGLNP